MATPWAPQAAHVAAQFGIPKGIFLGLVHQESGFNPDAVSPAGARGLTQLMPATARSLGVNMADPHAQLVGGAKYLKAQFDRFGSWKLALAAYNAGPGNVTDGAWQRIPETQNYVKTILGSVGKYGGVQPQAPAPPAAGPAAPQIPAPVLRGSAGLNVNAFAGDELGHLGDPGFALNNLANGSYDTPFSAKLTAIAAPKAATATTPTPSAPSPVGKSVVQTALTQMGQPYQWGGVAKLGSHTDCSGLVQAVFAAHGIQVPRTTYQQWRTGKPVPIAQLQPGDAVFFHSEAKGPSHVGIYVGGGKFINDPHTGAAVRIDSLTGYPGFVGARRFTAR